MARGEADRVSDIDLFALIDDDDELVAVRWTISTIKSELELAGMWSLSIPGRFRHTGFRTEPIPGEEREVKFDRLEVDECMKRNFGAFEANSRERPSIATPCFQ